MDIVGLVDSILSCVERIQLAAGAARSNRDKCGALAKRVKILSGDLAHRFRRNMCDRDVPMAMDRADAAFKRALDIVEYYGGMNRVKRFVYARSIKDDFEQISRELDSCMHDLVAFQSVDSAMAQEELINAHRDVADDIISQGDSIRAGQTELKGYFSKILSLMNELNGGEARSAVTAGISAAVTRQVQMPKAVVGIEEKVSQVKALLLNVNTKNVGLVGMGGIGKTTLAKAVYNDRDVQTRFDVLGWVTVGRDADLSGCQREIWNIMFPSEPLPESIDPNKARERLSAHLAHLEHRVLLVLDDIWKFGDLRDLVALGEHAHSTIMFTTRNAKIAKRANFEQHFVGLLDENLAMQLFCKWAFHADEVPADKANFARCAWEMATECGGLPLALTVIGSLASGYSMIEEWKSGLRKLRNSGSLSDDHEEQLMARLRHSYEDLDDDLKSFFLCLVGFPEDYHVKVSDLVEHWTALKYGAFEDGGHYIEDINEGLIDCCAMFGELVDRSLIIVDQSGLCGYQRREEDIAMSFIGFQDSAVESMSCYMHDSVRDMGRQVMSQLDPGERDRLVCPKVQLLRGKASSVTELWACSDPSVTWPDGIQLPALASLVAREAGLTSLPQCVIDCSQLRVLDVGFADMAALPDDISTLQSLQLLRIDGCSKISALPAGISALHRLVMLSARLCKSLGSLPSGIGALSTLSCLYLVGCGFGSIPRSIGNLQNLGKLDLSFCTNLRELPLTLGSLSHLECLNLAGCKNIKSLPDFSGLSCLRSLNVSGMEGITELPASLTSLGMLTLLDAQGCQKLKSFPEGSKQWPRLKVLQLQGCNELDGLPHMSGHLQKVSSLGLPLITEEELWCRFKDDALTDEQFERQLQAPVEICGRKLYLQCGSVNGSLRDWIWQHQERVEWMPREQYLYMTMKGSGRTIPQMKALMGVKLLEGESVDAVDKNGRTPLHNAAENKDVESLLKLIRAGANLDARDEFGRTPLHYAAVAGAVEAVTALLRAGAGVDAKDKYNSTPLNMAADTQHLDCLSALLEAGARELDTKGRSGRTPLMLAAHHGLCDIVDRLLQRGADVEAVDETCGYTALHCAASEGHTSVVRLLIMQGAMCDIDAKGHKEWHLDGTPADIARKRGNLEAAEMLEKEECRKYGRTALHFAARRGDAESVVQLAKDSDTIEALDSSGYTPLQLAAAHGRFKCVIALLKVGAQACGALTAKDRKNGLSPLHWASKTGATESVVGLLELGAAIDARDSLGRTPLMMAGYEGHLGVVEVLLDKGAEVDATDKYAGYTVLHHAAYKGHTSVVEALLRRGAHADIDAQGKRRWPGGTPAQIARKKGHAKIVRLMKDRWRFRDAWKGDGFYNLLVQRIWKEADRCLQFFYRVMHHFW